MKKTVLIISLLLIFSLCGCGSGSSTEEETTEPTTTTAAPATTTQATTEAEYDNPLYGYRTHRLGITSGDGSKTIGTHKYISVDYDTFHSLTDEQIKEYADDVIAGSRDKWFSILIDGGKCLCFEGCLADFPVYGDPDDDYLVPDPESEWSWNYDSGKYDKN